MSSTRTGLVAFTASFVTAVVVAASFQAAVGAPPDTTPPEGSLQSDFILGAQLSRSNHLNDDQCDDSTWLDHRISWTASDDSGIQDYTMWRVTSAALPKFLGWWSESIVGDDTYFVGQLSDYHGDCGGGSLETNAFAVTAYDMHGNAKWIQGGTRPTVHQAGGQLAEGGNDPDMFTYSGNWSNSTCACASGGRQIMTRQRGAWVSFTATGKIAVVMAKGPARGKARIFVDGARVATVDTHAATNLNRTIVWTGDVGNGDHTVRIRNLATAGHRRIDFDAVVFG